MSNELTKAEEQKLAKCEKTIERGMLDVGSALRQVRDDQLYRGTHKTFSAYLKDRWSWDRRRAYQLIEASEVVEKLCTMVHNSDLPTNERQARAIAQAPEDKQVEVLQKGNKIAASENRKPTAKDYEKAVEEVTTGESGDVEYDDLDDDDEEISAPQKSKIELVMENAEVGKQILNSIRQAKKLLKAVEEVPGTEELVSKERSIRMHLENAESAVSVSIPKCECPRCKGKGCPQCGNYGWINSVLARELNAK